MSMYGVSNPFQSEVIKKKTEETNRGKYGVATYFDSQDFLS